MERWSALQVAMNEGCFLIPKSTRTNGLERAMKRITSLLLLTSLIVGCGGSSEPKQASQSPAKAKKTAAKEVEKTAQTPEKKAVTYEQLMTAADELIEKRDANNAIKVLTAAIKAKPTTSTAYIKRAAILAEAKLLKQAIGDMNSAIAVESDNPKLRNTRGYFLLLLKEYSAAEKDFNKAIDLDKEYPQVYNNRGLVFIGQNQFIKAMIDFKTAIKLKPDYVDALNNLGFVYLQMEDPDYSKAVETFSQVLETNPEYLNAISNRGRAYFKLENYDSAIADFSQAIELQPANDQYYLHRSEAYKAAGQEELSRQDVAHVVWSQQLTEINRRIANNPKNINLWLARGVHLLKEGNIEQAEKSFDNALVIDGNNISAITERAKLHTSQDQFAEVVTLCTKSLEANDTTTIRSIRGDAHLQLGQLTEAITDFEACRRFDSRVVEAYRLRGEEYKTAGNAELAKADSDHAAKLEQQLSKQASTEEAVAPRAFVPVKFEETAAAEKETEVE